jgi:hypothetical protein
MRIGRIRIRWSGRPSFCAFMHACTLPRDAFFLPRDASDALTRVVPSRIYVDTRLHHTLDLRFDRPFFTRGGFPPVVQNGSDYIALQNPWVNGSVSAPFDQSLFFCCLLFFPSVRG